MVLMLADIVSKEHKDALDYNFEVHTVRLLAVGIHLHTRS